MVRKHKVIIQLVAQTTMNYNKLLLVVMQNMINSNNTNHRENTMGEKKNEDKLHNVIETVGKIELAISSSNTKCL